MSQRLLQDLLRNLIKKRCDGQTAEQYNHEESLLIRIVVSSTGLISETSFMSSAFCLFDIFVYRILYPKGYVAFILM